LFTFLFFLDHSFRIFLFLPSAVISPVDATRVSHWHHSPLQVEHVSSQL
jgi:hypothetical protein